MHYKYFNRDVSWLYFNYRVLEEAKDVSVPLYDRINFVAIYSSNLDEFYSVRVAEYRRAVDHGLRMTDVASPKQMLSRINRIVSNQTDELSDILQNQICPELLKHNIILYNGIMPQAKVHTDFMEQYFQTHIIHLLQPLIISRDTLVFLRNNRPYFAVKMTHKKSRARNPHYVYALVKLPINDLPRLIRLPVVNHNHIVFIDDIIRHNLSTLFPGYNIEGVWSIKVARDADFAIDDQSDIVQQIRDNLALRDTGVPASLYCDRDISPDTLRVLQMTFSFSKAETVRSHRYLNLDHLTQLGAYLPESQKVPPIRPIHPKILQNAASILMLIKRTDIVLHYPYESFDYVTRLLSEAAFDQRVDEIKITLYRVARNSAIVSSLVSAEHNGKRVTAFVELKARFDEKNNLELSEQMEEAGINVIYSIPRLKVHSKMLLICTKEGLPNLSCAYMSTGNFNEKTARQYTDHALITSDENIVDEVKQIFRFLADQTQRPKLNKLLVTRINMFDQLKRLIDEQTALARAGKPAYILLKMNGMQNRVLINRLYEASQAGVRIELIVRGICCLVPGEPFSQNIRVRRIVDTFLEHGRIWVFGAQNPKIYLTSSDWLNRNFARRIELAFPIYNPQIRQELLDILHIELTDNQKANLIDNHLEGHRVSNALPPIRSQLKIMEMLAANN